MSVTRRRPAAEPIEPDRFYTAKQLAARYQVHLITIFGWAKRGVIPPSRKIGPNCTRWAGRDIIKHEAALAEHGQ